MSMKINKGVIFNILSNLIHALRRNNNTDETRISLEFKLY